MQKYTAYFIGDEITLKVEVYGRGDTNANQEKT